MERFRDVGLAEPHHFYLPRCVLEPRLGDWSATFPCFPNVWFAHSAVERHFGARSDPGNGGRRSRAFITRGKMIEQVANRPNFQFMECTLLLGAKPGEVLVEAIVGMHGPSVYSCHYGY